MAPKPQAPGVQGGSSGGQMIDAREELLLQPPQFGGVDVAHVVRVGGAVAA